MKPYMEEYHLTPDELIAKDFRMIQSSWRGYYPRGKSEWIAAEKKSTGLVGRTWHKLSIQRHKIAK
jgi:hypothetical protein